MIATYEALYDHLQQKIIRFTGSKRHPPCDDVLKLTFDRQIIEARLNRLSADPSFLHLHRIDDAIFRGTVEFFYSINAEWCSLPVTTRMISSPGEVYRGQRLNYTTDAIPIVLKWFDDPRQVFLSESSQFYLELRLLLPGIEKVFSIYNSFRKEQADFSHLSEFQHIEFEGHVSSTENVIIALKLMSFLFSYLLRERAESLSYFLTDIEIVEAQRLLTPQNFRTITFREALAILRTDTKDDSYVEFSMRNFGAWEEIRLGKILGCNYIITGFPLIEIPFYHSTATASDDDMPVAQNADIILCGFREVIGAGVRIAESEALQKKAELFNLPIEDYLPYLESRSFPSYRPTAGFGLGWQRFLHWCLKLPAIWEATHIPRGHLSPIP